MGFIAIFAGDFVGYWRHRLEHTALLWPGHAIHHSDTAMTWTTGLRFHPINRLTTALIDTSVLALLGFPVWALIANNLVRHYYGLFIHMDLPWTYGPLGRVLVSPAMHRWHHIRVANGAGVELRHRVLRIRSGLRHLSPARPMQRPARRARRHRPRRAGAIALAVAGALDVFTPSFRGGRRPNPEPRGSEHGALRSPGFRIALRASGMTEDFMQTPTSLPAWLYTDQRFFELEREKVFRRRGRSSATSTTCRTPGDYLTLDVLGERVVTVRGEDGELRSFHNVCRHRAGKIAARRAAHAAIASCARITPGATSSTARFAGAPKWQGFENLDESKLGLKPVEQEIVRLHLRPLRAGPASVAEMMAPYAEELAAFELEKLVPNGRVTLRPRPVNWKNVGDNYSDGMHIPVAHPGSRGLFAGTYKIEAKEWIDKMWGDFTETPSNHWSERAVPKPARQPSITSRPSAGACGSITSSGRTWRSTSIPTRWTSCSSSRSRPTETMIREIAYVHPNANREMNAARYLNWRINRQVNAEDTVLIEGVQQGMESSSYATGPLSPSEVCLISFGNRMRSLIPEANLERAPAA